MKNIIYYFTGSGNTLAIAKDLAKVIKDTRLVRITKKNEKGLDARGYERVGFVFPVYFSGIPTMVWKFVKNIEISDNAYIYAIGNYGEKIDLGFHQIEKLLKKKDKSLNGSFGITMPGNYQILHDLDSSEKVVKKLADEKLLALEIGKKIMNKEATKVEGVAATTAIKGSIIYSFFKPYKMDRYFWSNDKCTSCGLCKKICPAQNITMVASRPKWNHQCEQCLSCLHFCPKSAIQYRRGTIKRGRYRHPEVAAKELIIKR